MSELAGQTQRAAASVHGRGLSASPSPPVWLLRRSTHLVHHDHLLAASEQRFSDRSADEAGAARDKDRPITLGWAGCSDGQGGRKVLGDIMVDSAAFADHRLGR